MVCLGEEVQATPSDWVYCWGLIIAFHLAFHLQDLKPENLLVFDSKLEAEPAGREVHDEAADDKASSKLPNCLLKGGQAHLNICLLDFDLCHVLASTPEAVDGHSVPPELGPSLQAQAPAPVDASPMPGPRFWGTADYVAPEVIERGVDGYSPASDWWWVGPGRECELAIACACAGGRLGK